MIQRPSSSTLTLTLIILLYLFCNLPRLALNLVEYLLMPEIYQLDMCGCYLAPWWLSSLIRGSHLLLTFNSSVNFLIYVSVCKRFKKVFNIRSKQLMEHYFQHTHVKLNQNSGIKQEGRNQTTRYSISCKQPPTETFLKANSELSLQVLVTSSV